MTQIQHLLNIQILAPNFPFAIHVPPAALLLIRPGCSETGIPAARVKNSSLTKTTQNRQIPINTPRLPGLSANFLQFRPTLAPTPTQFISQLLPFRTRFYRLHTYTTTPEAFSPMLTYLVLAIVAALAGVLLLVNLIPHVTVRGLGWMALRGISINLRHTTIHIGKLTLWVNFRRLQLEPYRMVHIALIDVSVHQQKTSDGSDNSDSLPPSVPEHLEFRVPLWAYDWFLKRTWMNQVDIHVFRCSVHHEGCSPDISAHFDYTRFHSSYKSSTNKYIISVLVMDGFLMNLRSKLQLNENLIKVFQNTLVVLGSTLIFSCCADLRKAMLVDLSDLTLLVTVLNPYITPISGLVPDKPKKAPKQTNDTSDTIPMLDQFVKAFAIASSVELRLENLKAEYEHIVVNVSNTLISLRREESYKLHTMLVASAYVNSFRVTSLDTKCVDVPSLTYIFECDMADLFRAFEAGDTNNFYVDIKTSLDLTHPSFDIYFDQIESFMAQIKLSSHKSKRSTEQDKKPFLAVPMSKYFRKMRGASIKLGISDARATLHLPAMDLESFVRSSVHNVSATASISTFLTKCSTKHLGKLLLYHLRPNDPPSSLKAFAKVKNMVLDVEENLVVATKLNVMAAYCLNTHRVKLKVNSRRLVVNSINNMIFYVVRRLRDSHIKHYNRMLRESRTETTHEEEVSAQEDESKPEVAFIDFLELLPECVVRASLKATEIVGTIICKDGLPSHVVEEDGVERDMGDYRRGVSLDVKDYIVEFDRNERHFHSRAKTTEVFVLSEYAAQVTQTSAPTYTEEGQNEPDFSDLLSIESFGDNSLDNVTSSKRRPVMKILDLNVTTEKNKMDKLILTVPEADGSVDMFLIWCIFYARSLLKLFQPTVKVEYSKEELKRMKGTQKRIKLDVHVKSTAIKILLPNDVDTLFEIEELCVSDASNWPVFDLKNTRLYVLHPATNAWCRLVSILQTHSSLGELLQETCFLKSRSIKIYVPFRFLIYTVIDNIITMVKATKQIMHNFNELSKGNFEFERLMPQAKPPILFPKIRWCADRFNLSLEEDLFETELSIIFQLGRIEHLIREKKWLQFELEAEKLRAKAASSSTELDKTSTVDEKRFLSEHKKKTHSHSHFQRNLASTFLHGFRNNLERSVPSNTDTKSEVSHEPVSVYTQADAEAEIERNRERLQEEISMSWITNFNRLKRTKFTQGRKVKTKVAGFDKVSPLMGQKYNIQKLAPGAPMMSVGFNDFDLTLDKAHIDDVDEFLRVYGKGQPKLDYSILIPLAIRLRASSFYISLRDYPLPLLLFPSNEKGTKVMDLHGNLVINEKLVHRKEEMRHIYVPFTAATKREKSVDNFYSVHVPRTLTPVKVMFDIACLVDTDKACIINWSKSYQAAILSAAGALDNFTKPQIDDSPIGWWDKMALIMHGKLRFDIPNELCLQIKSSSDPYLVVGRDAGYMWSWKHGVELKFNYTGDQKELIILDSYDFVFGVPDCSYGHSLPWSTLHPFNGIKENDMSRTFQKKVMKFSSDEKVRWRLGLLFERNEDVKCRDVSADHKRTDKFIPHYEVITTSPEFDWHPDSYEGFRSDYLHLAIGVTSVSKKGNSHNTAYLTPIAFAYFFYWWKSISNTVSMPVRHGKLFPAMVSKGSVKMSPHLVTVKYQLILEPLAVSHMYTSYENLDEGPRVIITGLKGKSEKCHIDLHQRKEVIRYVNEKLGIDKKVHHMKLHLGEVRVCEADIRAVKATFKDPSRKGHIIAYYTNQVDKPMNFDKYREEFDEAVQDFHKNSFSQGVQCNEQDFSWLDQDDFVELELREELSADPTIEVVPFFYTPRFTYFREFTLERVDHKYPFGREPSHVCVIGDESPETVQAELLKARAGVLRTEIDDVLLALEKTDSDAHSDKERLQKQIAEGVLRMEVVKDLYRDCAVDEELHEEDLDKLKNQDNENGEAVDHLAVPGEASQQEENDAQDYTAEPKATRSKSNAQSMYSGFKSLDQVNEITSEKSSVSEFHNRFLFHNVRLKWNNKVRNLVTTYMGLISYRRTEKLMMSKKAFDLIESFVEQQNQENSEEPAEYDDENFKLTFHNSGDVIEDFEQYLNSLGSDNHEMEYKYLIKFIRPQIQLESEVDPNSAMAVTSQDIEMQILQENLAGTDDIISEGDNEGTNTVESRHGVLFKDMHAYVFHKDQFPDEYDSPYGDELKKMAWPPWVHYEACVDSMWLQKDLVLEKTSMALILKKPNFLSMEQSSLLHADELSVHLAKVVVNATSQQYSSVYYILLNLLLDSKLAKEQLHLRLDQIIELSGLDDTTGLAEKVKLLQRNITICQHTLLSMEDKPLLADERHGASHVELELDKMYVQLAIITHTLMLVLSKRKGNRGVGKYWNIYADQVIWHLVENSNEPLVDFALAPSKFQRIDMLDGSNSNLVEISMMQGFNLRRNVVYPDFMLPLIDDPSYDKEQPVISMRWKMLSRVGGIRVMKKSRLAGQPASVQLDYATAQLLLLYLFPKDEKEDEKSESRNGSGSFSKERELSESLEESEGSESNGSKSRSSINPFRKIIAKRHSTPFSGFSTPSSPKGSFQEDSSSVISSRISSAETPSLSSETNRALGLKSRKQRNGDTRDDLSIIMNRSSKFFVIEEIEIPAMKLRVSFKAPKHLNIIDVHRLMLSVPLLQFKQKTWSGEDFVLQIKKELIRIILSHTGKIIGNKFRYRDRKATKEPLKQIQDFTSYVALEDLERETLPDDKESNGIKSSVHRLQNVISSDGNGNHQE